MVMRVGQDIGNYRLLAEISHGEFAIIYQAAHRILTNRFVAFKLLYTAQLPAQGDQEDFFREARVLAELQHPHILPLIDANIYEGFPYIITEFAAHGSLRNRLNRRPTAPLSVDEGLLVLRQVGEALHFAHQHNIVHGDVKPENILFHANTQAVLADFDIARVLSRANAAAQSLGGTAAYMSPEQFQGKVRKESDQYALACIAYELLTGKRPFRGDDQAALMHAHLYEQPSAPSQIHSGLSAQVDAVILKAMAKKYTDRYRNIPDFLAALNTAIEAGKPHKWSPLVLKSTAATRESDSTIYYEKTEISIPEEVIAPETGHAAPVARKRRTTKATAAEKTAAPQRVRATPVRAKTAQRKQADPTEEKKPAVKRSTSKAKTKPAISEASEVNASAEKKVVRKKRPVSVARKITADEPQAKTPVRKARTTKKAEDTPTKSPVAKKRTTRAKKEGTANTP
jgi:serine/threonine protein kinase